ncbi:MAG TPA: hypothetical protein VN612_15690 [Acidobacteriaceae bacterium]|nr:hypothetical protein [Acidobacteriaceae bacterium]
MKNLFFAFFQFVIFFVIFGAFSLFPPFHLEKVIGTTAEGTRIFIWDGLLISFALAILIMVIETVRGRIQRAGPWTSGAFVLSTVAGLALKFGFLTH